jgi:deoxyhypusine synthase
LENIFEIIRQDKVHIIVQVPILKKIMNLVAHSHYERVPNYRDLTSRRMGFTRKRFESCYCIYQNRSLDVYKSTFTKQAEFSKLPGVLEEYYEIDLKDSLMQLLRKIYLLLYRYNGKYIYRM